MDGHQDDYFVTAPGPADTHRSAPPGVGRPTPPPRTGLALLVLVVSVLVVGAAVAGLLIAFVTAGGAPELDEAADVAGGDGNATAVADARPAMSDPVVEDGFSVWGRRPDGSPVRWDPCEPIHWVLNLDGAPPAAHADVTAAFTLVTNAGGNRFVFDGFTDEPASWERPLLDRSRYGSGWAPVLVAWTTTEDALVLEEDQRGAAVPVAVTASDDGPLFVTGQVVLNGDRELSGGFGDRQASWGGVLAHEAGHLVGLDHVDDPTQLMFPTVGVGPSAFGAGDRRGLAAVADGGCLDVPPAQDLEVDYRDGLRN